MIFNLEFFYGLLSCFSAGIGGAMLINGICLFFTTNFNLGNLLLLLVGSILLVLGLWGKAIFEQIPHWIFYATIFFLILYLCLAIFVFSYGADDNVSYDEDAVIVLGAGIRGETITGALKGRLDATLEYHSKNPQATIIVSGGQGPQEAITEALAMSRYLISNGVAPERVLMEDRSTSTFENFTFSKKILDKKFSSPYKIAYITNEYHIYRAGSIAKKAGFDHVSHCHSDTVWYLIGAGVLRENLAVLKHWIIGG